MAPQELIAILASWSPSRPEGTGTTYISRRQTRARKGRRKASVKKGK